MDFSPNCCACMGTCNHTGPHYYCNYHGGTHQRYNPDSTPPPCPSCASLLSRAKAVEAALCRARQMMILARTLNGTECGATAMSNIGKSNLPRCGQCFYCIIDYCMAHLNDFSLCPHELEAKRLRKSLEAAHFTDEGGEYWKPPVNDRYRELWEEKERLREALSISPDEVGRIMHESWMRTKRTQGFHHPRENHIYPRVGMPFAPKTNIVCEKCHLDLVPWEKLPEAQKDINRHAFDNVLAELRRRAGG